MEKETVIALFKVISRHFPGGTEKNHKDLTQDSRSPGRYLNLGTPEYEAEVLTTRLRRSISGSQEEIRSLRLVS
jgi:hypothetical protein